ncbi:hypothetical protein EIM00_25720 [Pseudomonas aeruginosa]|nr:hypothetical protein EGV95_18800 [Pseudomonas aeruginosa]MCO1833047.1 hypothetical protein [Pseudomonas aeruginosa]MCO1838124.1 hypothetical protein [Pseudomonas aeruginosa]MCO1884486.1 hypothetical protein [Pseudomonas aeruginosa]MCO1973126.1 hypothetical protein [Pseudomonas aeruginosa]
MEASFSSNSATYTVSGGVIVIRLEVSV